MLLSLCLVAGYIYFGQTFLSETVSPIIHGLSVVIIGVVTLFSLGCGLHMVFVGDRSGREVKRDIRNQLIELGDYVDFAGEKIKNFENQSKFHMHAIRPVGLDCLGQSRRIVHAIAERVNTVNDLLRTKGSITLIEADQLLSKDLSIAENCVNSLIGATPIPPLPAGEWIPTVNRLLDKVEAEVERIKQAA